MRILKIMPHYNAIEADIRSLRFSGEAEKHVPSQRVVLLKDGTAITYASAHDPVGHYMGRSFDEIEISPRCDVTELTTFAEHICKRPS